MKGEAIRKCLAYTALVFPSVLFAFLHLLNFFLISVNSSGAVPFGTFAAIVALCASTFFDLSRLFEAYSLSTQGLASMFLLPSSEDGSESRREYVESRFLP